MASYRTAGDGAVFDEGDKVAPLTTGTDPSSHILAYGIRTANTSSNGWGIQEESTHTLDRAMGLAVAFNHHKSGNGGSSLGIAEDRTDCLRADNKSPFAVAFDWKMGEKARSVALSENLSPTLATGADRFAVHSAGMQVRRLTPVECERLQGFPDNYTLIPMRKRSKKAEQQELSDFAARTHQEDIKWSADGPRYKALGNSMAVPVMAWIGERIQAVEDLTKTAKEAA